MEKQIYIKKYTERTLSYTAGELASFRIKDGMQTTVRVYDNGFIGVAGKSGDADINELEEKAVKALEGKMPYVAPIAMTESVKIDAGKEIVKKSELMKEGEKLIKEIASDNPDFIVSGKTVLRDDTDILISGDNKYENIASGTSTYFLLKERTSASIMDEIYEVSGDKFETEKIRADVNVLAKAYKNILAQPEEDDIVVIADSSVCHYVLTEFMAQSYASGSSLLSGKLGKKVFSDKFTMYCEKDPLKSAGAVFFDGEGVVNDGYRSYFVKNGVLEKLFTTRQSAAKYKVDNCGTAAAPFAALPSEGMSGIKIEATAENVKDIVKGEKAVFVSVSSGGDMTSTGDIALPVQTAYVYENGRLAGRLPEFTVAVNIFDMLGKDFLGASDNCVWTTGERNYIVFKAKAVNKQ